MLYNCLFKCNMPPADIEEKYFRQSLDLKCEDACYSDFLKMSNEGFNKVKIGRINEERETCMSGCFIPRRGTTDSQMCMEKCNVQYDK